MPTRCSNMTGTQLDEVGNTEMLSWAVMFGAIGARRRRADRLHPDLAPRAGMMRFLPQRARTQRRRPRSRSELRRLQVPEPGLPVLQAPAGGGVRPEQAAVRVAPQRRTCAAASSTTSTRWRTSTSCTAQQRKAAEELINVGKGGLVSEHVGPLAEAGAHPLQALMSLARDLLDEPPARTAGDGGGTGEALTRWAIQGLGLEWA